MVNRFQYTPLDTETGSPIGGNEGTVKKVQGQLKESLSVDAVTQIKNEWAEWFKEMGIEKIIVGQYYDKFELDYITSKSDRFQEIAYSLWSLSPGMHSPDIIKDGFTSAVQELGILEKITEPTYEVINNVISVTLDSEIEDNDETSKVTILLDDGTTVELEYATALGSPNFAENDTLVIVLSENNEPLEYIRRDVNGNDVESWYVDNGVLEIHHFVDTEDELELEE